MAWKKRTSRTPVSAPLIETSPTVEPHNDPLAEEPAGSRHVGDPQLRVAVTRAVRLANDRQDPHAGIDFRSAASW